MTWKRLTRVINSTHSLIMWFSRRTKTSDHVLACCVTSERTNHTRGPDCVHFPTLEELGRRGRPAIQHQSISQPASQPVITVVSSQQQPLNEDSISFLNVRRKFRTLVPVGVEKWPVSWRGSGTNASGSPTT